MDFNWTSEHSITITDEDFQQMIAEEFEEQKEYYTDPMGEDFDEVALDAARSWTMGLDDVDFYSLPWSIVLEIADELKRRIKRG